MRAALLILVVAAGGCTLSEWYGNERGIAIISGRPGGPGVADGTATAAHLWNPIGIAAHGTTLYVADQQSNRIRRVNLATGATDTLAGWATGGVLENGTANNARFFGPTDVAFDESRNVLYVADQQNCAIRKIDVGAKPESVQYVTTLYQSSDCDRQYGIFRVALSTSTDSLYFSIKPAQGPRDVQRLDLTNPNTPTGLSTVNAPLYPAGMLIASGFLYVSDAGEAASPPAIRKISLADPASPWSTVVQGTPLQNPTGLAAADDGTIYIANAGEHTIRQLVPTETILVAGVPNKSGSDDGNALTQATLYSPVGLAFASGTLYIASGSQIRAWAVPGGAVTTLVGSAAHHGSDDGPGTLARLSWPHHMATDGTDLFVTTTSNILFGQTNQVRRIELATRTVSTLHTFDPPVIITGMVVAGAAVYVAQLVRGDPQSGVPDRCSIAKLKLSGEVTDPMFAGVVACPIAGLGADDNFLYFDNYDEIQSIALATPHDIAQVVTRKSFARTFASSGLFAVDGMQVIDYSHGTYDVIAGDGTGGYTDAPSGIAAEFSALRSIASDGKALYVGDQWNSLIRRIDLAPGHAVTTFAGRLHQGAVETGPLPGGVNLPVAMVYLKGDLYIADYNENVVLRLSL